MAVGIVQMITDNGFNVVEINYAHEIGEEKTWIAFNSFEAADTRSFKHTVKGLDITHVVKNYVNTQVPADSPGMVQEIMKKINECKSVSREYHNSIVFVVHMTTNRRG
jgi:hypothetical protein